MFTRVQKTSNLLNRYALRTQKHSRSFDLSTRVEGVILSLYTSRSKELRTNGWPLVGQGEDLEPSRTSVLDDENGGGHLGISFPTPFWTTKCFNFKLGNEGLFEIESVGGKA